MADQDELAAATGSVALLMVLNKPIYPVYVWFLADSAFRASLLSLASLPFYIAIWFLARRGASLPARAGLVAVGTLDTVLISMALGPGSGALWFLFACIMLAGGVFYADEKWISRGLVAAVFVAFIAMLGRYGMPPADGDNPGSLFALNLSGAAALAVFIALRFPRISRGQNR